MRAAIKIATGAGCFSSPNPIAAFSTNSVKMPKIINTFHSSGTPTGIADRTPRWKSTNTVAATIGSTPNDGFISSESNSASGAIHSAIVAA